MVVEELTFTLRQAGVFYQMVEIALCKEVDGIGKLDESLTSRNDVVQLPLHGHLNLFRFFTVFRWCLGNLLNGCWSSEYVIVSYHVLTNFGVVGLECGFKKSFSLFIWVQLLF